MISAVDTEATRFSAQVASAKDFFGTSEDFEKLKSAMDAIFNGASLAQMTSTQGNEPAIQTKQD